MFFGVAILAGEEFLPGPFSSDEEKECSIRSAIESLARRLAGGGLIASEEPIEQDRCRATFAASEECSEIIGEEVCTITIRHNNGDPFPATLSGERTTKLAVVFDLCPGLPEPSEDLVREIVSEIFPSGSLVIVDY